jgi:hypothetical protein
LILELARASNPLTASALVTNWANLSSVTIQEILGGSGRSAESLASIVVPGCVLVLFAVPALLTNRWRHSSPAFAIVFGCASQAGVNAGATSATVVGAWRAWFG